MRTIYQKQLYQLGLKNINDFMRIYYPEYFTKEVRERKEIARCFYGNVPNSSVYNEVLSNAMSKVNGNEDLLSKRVVACKQNPINSYQPNRQIKAEKRKQTMKNWFKYQLPKLYEKIEKELGIEVLSGRDLGMALEKYGFTESQIQKIYTHYYIGEEQMKYLNDIIENKSLHDIPTTSVKVRPSSQTNRLTAYKEGKNKLTIRLEEYKPEIIEYVKKNYKTYQNFIDSNVVEGLSLQMFHNWKGANKLSVGSARKLLEWWKSVQDEQLSYTEPEKIQLEIDDIETIEQPRKKLTLKTRKIVFKEVISGNDIKILENFINSILSEKDIQDILFAKEYEFLKVNETKIDSIMLSFIKNTDEYRQKEIRYNCISKQIKELASVIETE